MPPAKPPAVTLAGVAVSLGVAMMLRILPLPAAWFIYNPDWVALLLIYWTLMAPDRVGMVTALIAGLTVDALTGRLLGQHALGYVVMVYLNLRAHKPLSGFPASLYGFWVLLLLLVSQWLVLWTQRVEIAADVRLTYWLPAATGALVWPLLYWLIPYLVSPADEP